MMGVAKRFVLGHGVWVRPLARLLAVVCVLVFAAGGVVMAQSPKTGIEDTWQGTLHPTGGKDLRTVLKISRDDKGALTGQFYSIDQNPQPIKLSSISFQDGVLKYTIEMADLKYEGKMSSDGKSIVGTSTQGQPLPLIFERATQETAWAIPEPPKRLPQMPADANPTFEVATIKPSAPDEPGKLFGLNPSGHFKTINTTLTDLIKFAYDLQDKQIIGAPEWASSVKWDIEAQPDIHGMPDIEQMKSMVKKLLADRFQLKFHDDKRELSAYVLTVAKSGPKLKKSEGDPKMPGGLFFRGLGTLTVTNSDMDAFCQLMQSAVLDRPVVNHTELAGKWDFLLKWTPDESQFGGMGAKVPPPTDAADAPPPLFTALPEQLGLKMDAEKATVKTLVMDHADKPGDN
jgi:uncharacterized protein (TIGR03435 family)